MTEFLDSMPAAYVRAFSASEAAEHAEIVARRGSQLTHAEICASGSRMCVVGEDRPGLLALVTDALLVHGLGIRSAQVYCRQRSDGKAEAVDFFELQSQSSGESHDIGTADLSAFLQTLSELVAEDVLAASRVSTPPPSGGGVATRVYFELEALRRGEFQLLVEAPDSDGLLNAITNALHDEGVRILASEIRTEQGAAYDRFDLASNDAQPLSALRLCDIQQAVLAALPGKARAALTAGR